MRYLENCISDELGLQLLHGMNSSDHAWLVHAHVHNGVQPRQALWKVVLQALDMAVRWRFNACTVELIGNPDKN